jgi:cyclophilin family peptidyl-prolyl cis-trans isomerase
MKRTILILALSFLVASEGTTAEPPCTRLLYGVATAANKDKGTVDYARLLEVMEKRCNPGLIPRAKVRKLDDGRIEVAVFWKDPDQVRRIERVLYEEAAVEFRVLADSGTDAELVARARKSRQQILRDAAGKRVASWLPVAPRCQSGVQGNHDCVTRKAAIEGFEVLVLADGYTLRADDVRSVRPADDYFGRATAVVGLTPAGIKRLNEFADPLLPAPDSDLRHRIAVVVNGSIHEIPLFAAKIGDLVVIGAKDFSCQEVEILSGILDSGPMPVRLEKLRSAAEKTPTPGQSAAPTARRGMNLAHFHEVCSLLEKINAQRQQWESKHSALDAMERSRHHWDISHIHYAQMRLLVELAPLAERTHAEAPNTDPEVTAFLKLLVLGYVSEGDYQEALRLARTVIASGSQDKAFYAAAGLATFALGDFSQAERYLKGAKGEEFPLSFLGKSVPRNERLSSLAADCLEHIPDYQEASQREQQLRVAEAKAGDLPRVLFKTGAGEIEVELFAHEAPKTVAHFLSLVRSGYYNGAKLERIIALEKTDALDDPLAFLRGKKKSIPSEAKAPNRRVHLPGSLSMISDSPDSVGPRIAVAMVPARHLDGINTVFGRVVKGMDSLARLQRSQSRTWSSGEKGSRLEDEDKILEAKVLGKGPADAK